MDTTDLLEFRREKDRFFAGSDQSPLSEEDRARFSGLRYYEPNPDLVFTVRLEPADASEIEVETTDGKVRLYHRAGRVSLDVVGQAASLTLYATGQPGLFIPFRDDTSGKETYGAGRYLDIDPNPDGTVTLDFNLAYNPYCAYGDAYSCPLPPVENWLQLPIEAGELDYLSR